jgi:hypothetical protein
MEEAVNIGKGMKRVRVRSRTRRERAARVHEVIVEGDRVIFPASLFGAVMAAIGQKKEGKRASLQIKIEFGGEDE